MSVGSERVGMRREERRLREREIETDRERKRYTGMVREGGFNKQNEGTMEFNFGVNQWFTLMFRFFSFKKKKCRRKFKKGLGL